MCYKVIFACLFSFCIFLTSGCTTQFVGAGDTPSASYIAGSLESTLPYDINQVYAASLDGLQQLQITPLSTEVDNLAGRIMALRSDGSKISFKLRHVQQGITKLNIRVGMLGDPTHSSIIYEKITASLSKAQ